MPKSPQANQNRLLASLSREDFALLAAHLQPVDLPLRRQLEYRNKRIDHAYFIDAGIASVVANGPSKRPIEIGIIGREGVSALAVLMGDDHTTHDTYMQVSGAGRRVSAAKLRQCIEESASLRGALLRYAHSFLIQAANTAHANGRHTIEERLARWLLMARDRVDSDTLTLTHELLAATLGVRRPGVTVALGIMEQRGLIQPRRGAIEILDRKRLQEAANGAYRDPGAEFRRVFA